MSAELKAGFFVLAALAALVIMTTKLTQNRYSFIGVKRYYANISDATGLLSKSKVKMAGLDVGQLLDIELAGKHARIEIEVAKDVNVHQDGHVTIKAIGFLGDKYIELYPGTEASPLLPEGGTLPESASGGGLDQLTAKTTEVLENIKEITETLKYALKGSDNLDPSDSRLDRILDNMEEFSEGLASLDKLGEMSDRMNDVAANLQEITNKIRKGEGTVGKLLNDSETIDKINTTISGVNKFLTKADQLSIQFDARSSALVTTGGSVTQVSLAFQPTWDKYYLVGIEIAPKGTSSVTQTVTTNSPNSGGSNTSTQIVETDNPNAISFNAQFAKRFGDFVARLGLFETTGGLGADYNLFDDRAKVTAELYRFQKGFNPQVNLAAEFRVFKPFFLWTGGYDIANTLTRNYFVGAGIHFSDQDLKTLISAAIAAPRF